LQGVWGTPHQAKGGDSSESPPAVFWLQKTLLAKDVSYTLMDCANSLNKSCMNLKYSSGN